MENLDIDLEIFLFKRAVFSNSYNISAERQSEIDKKIIELWGLDICL